MKTMQAIQDREALGHLLRAIGMALVRDEAGVRVARRVPLSFDAGPPREIPIFSSAEKSQCSSLAGGGIHDIDPPSPRPNVLPNFTLDPVS